MGFLSQAVLRKKATAATTEKHPLLKVHDVPLDVKRAYLQGCVLAVLERDDGRVSDSARHQISQLGLALGMTGEDVTEIISVVSGISSPESQEEFLSELFAVLAGDVYPRYFMVDFERLLSGGAELTLETQKTLDYFGSSLTGATKWRSAIVPATTDGRCEVSQTGCNEVPQEEMFLTKYLARSSQPENMKERVIALVKGQFPHGGSITDYAKYVQDMFNKARQGEISGLTFKEYLDSESALSRFVDVMCLEKRLAWLGRLFSRVYGLDEWSITADADFSEYGISNADTIRFGNKACQALGLSASESELSGVSTIRELDEVLRYKRSYALGLVWKILPSGYTLEFR